MPRASSRGPLAIGSDPRTHNYTLARRESEREGGREGENEREDERRRSTASFMLNTS